jgi:hypothetical protein
MLKIKDNVDLEELEEYGFDDCELCWNKKLALGFYINVDVNTRIISIHHWAQKDNDELDIIYDLINTGFVEKVND